MSGPAGKLTGAVLSPFKKLFGSLTPNTPKIPKAIMPPTYDEAEAARIEQDRLRRRRGRAANMLSTQQSRQGSVGVNKLLGGGA